MMKNIKCSNCKKTFKANILNEAVSSGEEECSYCGTWNMWNKKTKSSKTVEKKTLPQSKATPKFKVGDKAVKVINFHALGSKDCTYCYIHSKSSHKGYVNVSDSIDDEPYGHEDLHAYNEVTGQAFENIIMGCSSELITLKEAKAKKIKVN